MVKACQLVQSVAVANTLGEGVLWNQRTQSVWWTDIQRARLYEYDLAASELRSWETPYRVACFGFVADSSDLVVAFDCGIAIYSVRTGAVDWLVAPGALADGTRFNDGRIDTQGRFWLGSMVEEPGVPAGSAALYCYESGVGLVEHVTNITISNGLCWSPDATVMYHADSPRNTIFAYDFDAQRGLPSRPRTFARTAAQVHPDGATVDSQGGLWSAQWGGGQVVRYDTHGQVDVVIELPVRQPTCVAFGGTDLNLLMITTARDGLSAEELSAQPGAGDLFVYRTAYRGLPACNFRRPQ